MTMTAHAASCSADFCTTPVVPTELSSASAAFSAEGQAWIPDEGSLTRAMLLAQEATPSLGGDRMPTLELKTCMERHYLELENIFARYVLQPGNHKTVNQLKPLPENRSACRLARNDGDDTPEETNSAGDKDHSGVDDYSDVNANYPSKRQSVGFDIEGDCDSEGQTHDDDVDDDVGDDDQSKDRGKVRESRKRKQSKSVSISFRTRSEEIERSLYRQNFCGLIVRRTEFDQLCAVVIILSSLLVGLEVEYRSDSNALVFDILGYIFIFFYTTELAIRVGARGVTFLAKSPDQNWNFFDLFCVSSSYAELLISNLLQEENGSLLLLLRTIRLVRIARIIRVVRFLGSLRLMVHTVLGAMKMLGWASLLILIITYMVSVSFTEAAKSVMQDPTVAFSGDRAKLEDYFGTMLKTMITMFQSIANGVSWREPMLLLEGINGMYSILFVSYISITVLTILNVITGLCCDYAINNASVDRDDAIRATLKDIEKWKRQFRWTFKSLDKDESGEISTEELGHMLFDEEFNAYLSYLHVSVDDVLDIFDVFDLDGSGQVSLEEFVDGCMKVKGTAKALDLMKVKKDIMVLRKEIAQLADMLKPHGQRG